MDESSTDSGCELEYIGEGYGPSWAAEICANEEGRRSDEEMEKASKDKGWEYWLGSMDTYILLNFFSPEAF